MFDVIGQVLVGWLLADLLSGVVHWWMDRYGDPRWPVIGPYVIAGNLEHHERPLSFLGASLLFRNRGLWVVVGSLSGLWLYLDGPSVLWLTVTVVGGLSGEVHVLAHRPNRDGLLLRSLRATGLVQSPAQHARHHRAPNDSRFCVVTNWLNPMLDELGVWRGLETALARIGVRSPRSI